MLYKFTGHERMLAANHLQLLLSGNSEISFCCQNSQVVEDVKAESLLSRRFKQCLT